MSEIKVLYRVAPHRTIVLRKSILIKLYFYILRGLFPPNEELVLDFTSGAVKA